MTSPTCCILLIDLCNWLRVINLIQYIFELKTVIVNHQTEMVKENSERNKETIDNKITVASKENVLPMLGVRHAQIAMLFACMVLHFCHRVNISIAMVAMVDKQGANPDFEDFQWSEQKQSVVLSSFFWGYAVPQIPAGYLADKYGSKYILMCTTLLSGIATILSPLSASLYGWQGLCILRVIIGFSQGFLFPSIFSMVSNWSYEKERAELGSYCVLGSDVGTILMISVSGFIAESSLGWPSIFYIPGFATIVWAVIWFIFANNSPAENRNISKIERNFIEQSKVEKVTNLKIPWLEILRSIPVFAFIVTSSVQNWGYSIMLLKLPAYMKNVLNFDIKENALLSALPYVTRLGLGMVFIHLSFFCAKRKLFTLNFSRKLFNTIAFWIPTVAMIALSFSSSNITLSVILVIVSIGVNIALNLGYQFNAIDITPNYSGTVFGIANFIGNVTTIFATLLTGFIVTNEADETQWRIVFLFVALAYFVGNLIFLFLGRTTIQPWNDLHNDSIVDTDKIAVPIYRSFGISVL